ncbi:MAG: glycosyltransferase family 39 protein, partial [Chloroflexota bacterium]|nr:glycosyltransferase family 39 protein [Chloroflexota bacterium]
MTDGQAAHHRPSRRDWLVLVAILISAFSLRFYDVNWDNNRFLHPDELFVTIRANDQIHFDEGWTWETLRNPDTSPLNPRSRTCGENICNYSYGALPLIITDFTAEMMARVIDEKWSNFDFIPRVGRTISSFVDTITVLLIFLLAARLFGPKPGLLAAAVYAGTPLAIQLSHFFTTDIWLACFVALTLWTSVVALDRERHGWFILAGASFGFALATKGSILFLSGAVAVAAILVAVRYFDLEDPAHALTVAISRLIASGAAALGAFALFEPYALMRTSVYIDQLQEQQMMSSGEIDFPFTRRYVGTTPILYQIEQLLRWGM